MKTPKEIRTDHDFADSIFNNFECEVILRNIILLQKANPEAWTPFSWDDYKAFCTHNVSESERGVLDAFTNGGRPVYNTSAVLSADASSTTMIRSTCGEFLITIGNCFCSNSLPLKLVMTMSIVGIG